MTLTKLLTFLEPTTLELKISTAPQVLSLLMLPFADNALQVCWFAPLSMLPLYILFRITEYQLRDEPKTKNTPKKFFSEYLANTRFDDYRTPLTKEELEALLRTPIQKSESLELPKGFHIDKARILYRFR